MITDSLFYVWNVTDKCLACPDKMTNGAAMQFMKDLREKFKRQGYYKTATGLRINPDNVLLAAVSAEIIEKEDWKQNL